MSRRHHNLDGLFLGYLLGMNSNNRNDNDDGGGSWLGAVLFVIFIVGLFCGPLGWLVSFAIFCLGLVWLIVAIIIDSVQKRRRNRRLQETLRAQRVATEPTMTLEQTEARIIQDKKLKRKGNIALGVIVTAVTAIAALAGGSVSVWSVLLLMEVLLWGAFLYAEFA
jgi:hypothetical protein